jgi:MFS family permease
MCRTGLWAEPDFLKLWAGQAISQIGSWISHAGLPLAAVLVLGASPLQMGILSGVGAAAVLLFGLLAGAWADRLRRRPILIVSDLGRAAVLGTVPVLAAMHRLTMTHLYAVAAAVGLLTVLFDVSYQAYVPGLVSREMILDANSKLALAESTAEIAGPGIAGMLVQWLTAPIAILFDAISFVVSAASLWLIRKPEAQPEPPPEPHMGREIAAGLRVAWQEPLLRVLVQRTATASFFLGFASSLYILFAIRELRLTAVMLGLIISIGGASNLLGAVLAGPLVRRFGFGRTFIASAVVAGVANLVVPLAHGSVAVCATILIAAQLGDIAWPVYNINDTSLRQAVTPDRLLGRVNAAMHLVFRGMVPLGALASGILAQESGIRITMLIGALGFLLSTLILVFSPIRDLHELPGTAKVVGV